MDISSAAAQATTPAAQAVPTIGAAWPGLEGSVYAGIARGVAGQPDYHLVLLADKPAPEGLNWRDALAWAAGIGAAVPTRDESALLYAHVRDQFDADYWHWTSTQYSAGDAWLQDFDYGDQGSYGKKFEARARAVRRLIL